MLTMPSTPARANWKLRGLAFVTAVLTTATAIAQQPVPAAQPAATHATAAQEPDSPNHTGIKVHGHWVIDVRDKDGKLVEHRDFENALTASGASNLTAILAGNFLVSGLNIELFASTNPFYILYDDAVYSPNCKPQTTQGAVCYSGLVSSVVSNGVQLQGQFSPSTAIAVVTVQTEMIACVPTNTVAVCRAGIGGNTLTEAVSQFTAKPLDTPLAVAAGQIVTVTVTLSFS